MTNIPIIYPHLTHTDRAQIAEILDRRANDVATFREDVERKLGQKLDDYRGSADLALTREVSRLRRLANKVRPAPPETPDEEE